MLIGNRDGTFRAGEADIICILKLPTGTFHAAFFEEHPMFGPVKPIHELDFVRLKSKMHHTGGAETLEQAKIHVQELRETIKLPDENVVCSEAVEVDDPVSVWILPNWTNSQNTLEEALLGRRV